MAPLSRRQFFKKTATDTTLAALLAAQVAKLRAASPYDWPIGMQIFPLRQMIDTDFRGTMKQVADAGIQTVELLSPWYNKHNFGLADMEKYTGAEIQKILGDLGLKAVSAHVDMTECRGEELPKIIQWAKDRGLSQICVPSLDGPTKPPDNTMDTVKRLCDEYNHAGEMSQKAGLKQGLHTEGFELSMVDGKRVFDHMLTGLIDPKLVRFQFQISTIAQGLDPVNYFNKYPGRFISMHLQDVDLTPQPAAPPPPAPAKTDAPGGAGQAGRGRGRGNTQKPIGQGSVDWKAVFTAAKTGGVQNYFIEMNLDLVKASVPYLKGLKI
jgi:sugar phosphate isomerase/epimerase